MAENFNWYVTHGTNATTADGTYGDSSQGGAWAGGSFDTQSDFEHVHLKVTKKPKQKTVDFFFKIIKRKLTILQMKKLKTRMAGLEKLVTEYMERGQWALAEESMNYLERIIRESEIYAVGFTLFLEREHVELFQQRTEDSRNLFLTDLKEYMRQIPPDVQKKLKLAQEHKLFDAYKVLHYDPAMKGVSKKEKKKITEKRKDPILFGMIKQSSRLYFVGDWVDKYCDLTLVDIIDKVKIDEEGIVLTKDINVNDFLGKARDVVKRMTRKKPSDKQQEKK
jgi:hypothetical protein